MNQYLTGSRAFFDCISGFTPHDTDIVEFDASLDYPVKIVSIGDVTKFIWKYDKSSDIINFMLANQEPTCQVIMLLIDKIAERINLKIDDLQLVKPLIEKLNGKHGYIKIIYKYIILNNDFRLTEKQLLEVYNDYLKYRK